jgi:hypothetical protein
MTTPERQEYLRNWWKQPGRKRLSQIYHNTALTKPKRVLSILYCAARVRARKRGIEFTIQREDLVMPNLCPVFRVPMVPRTKHAPSIDRKDNTKGYVPGNVFIISKRANSIKREATKEDLEALVQYVNS